MRCLKFRAQWFFLLLVVIFGPSCLVLVSHLPSEIPQNGFGTPDVLSHQHVDTKSILRSRSSQSRLPGSNGTCSGYDGVLHIEYGDRGGAAGTIFFIYIVNQLIYAEKYNLMPWIHLNNVSRHVYDPLVHSKAQTTSFEMMSGMTIDFVTDGYRRFGLGSYAGSPKKLLEDNPLKKRTYTIAGTGVWNHYFEPVSNFDPTKGECSDKPLLKMHYHHLNPSMLLSCPWSVKSWPYRGLVGRLAPKPKTTLKEWYYPMRQRGNEIVKKYVRFRPEIVEQTNQLVTESSQCLAMHIRHSDKAGTNRKKIPIEDFLPYAQAYLAAGGHTIVLATDSTQVLATINEQWPRDVIKAIVRQPDVLRSSDKKAVFMLGENSHDRTNKEVLVDILAMSRCHYFLHGFSAVSEAVIYLNLDLHEHSVDLEEHPSNVRLSHKEFQKQVQKLLNSK